MNPKIYKSRIKLVIIMLLLTTGKLHGNNLIISNPSLHEQNKTQQYTLIKFDVKWDNSWRVTTGPSNWDAAWIFVKYRLQGQTTWHHTTLNHVNGTGSTDGHTEPAGSDINSSNDNGSSGSYGVFIRAAGTFSQSNVVYNNVSLRWNYGADGLSDDDKVEVCVLGIEMVYVPQGSFNAGSGGSETGAFYKTPSSTDPYLIGSENAITVGTGTGELNYPSGGDNLGPIPANFP